MTCEKAQHCAEDVPKSFLGFRVVRTLPELVIPLVVLDWSYQRHQSSESLRSAPPATSAFHKVRYSRVDELLRVGRSPVGYHPSRLRHDQTRRCFTSTLPIMAANASRRPRPSFPDPDTRSIMSSLMSSSSQGRSTESANH